ncbi:MAG: hypothetical protein KF760_34135 [Candidatus Eremiobacteraeota bacterium]|nr:hypothetical protein [Candidatus Eremiobacteraeota bacterium]MCW5871080.1 hypothetical protein [Candidatus Eremiobacteraeota bacterium]
MKPRPLVWVSLLTILLASVGIWWLKGDPKQPVYDWREVTVAGVRAGSSPSQVEKLMGKPLERKGKEGSVQVRYKECWLSISDGLITVTGNQIERHGHTILKIQNTFELVGVREPTSLDHPVNREGVIELFGEPDSDQPSSDRSRGDGDREMSYGSKATVDSFSSQPEPPHELIVSLDGSGLVESFSVRWKLPPPQSPSTS